jgi:hypothetical protein
MTSCHTLLEVLSVEIPSRKNHLVGRLVCELRLIIDVVKVAC